MASDFCIKCNEKEIMCRKMCKQCYAKINYQENKEQRKQYQRDYKKKDPEKVRASQRRYMRNNPNISKEMHNKVNFNGLREKIIERDGFKCVTCKISQQDHLIKHNCSLLVHHIDGEGRYSKNPNNDPNNLQTLCKRCHSKIHGKATKKRTPLI